MVEILRPAKYVVVSVSAKVTGKEPAVSGCTISCALVTLMTLPMVISANGAEMCTALATSGLPLALTSTYEPTNSAATVVTALSW